MFKETILEIDHELEWISYELGRQSTSQDQAETLKKRKEHLLSVHMLCKSYNEKDFLSIEKVRHLNNQ